MLMEVNVLDTNTLIEFKPWIQTQIKNNILPILRVNGYKRGRTDCYIRERNDTAQFIRFVLKSESVTVWLEESPIYFPLDGGSYIGEVLRQEESWIYTSGVRAKLIHDHGLKCIVTDEVVQKWDAAEKIITESMIPLFEQFSSLEKLMTRANFVIPDNDVWRGIKWYAEGVYECLSNRYDDGMEKLRKAQKCKSAYIEFLKRIGCGFGGKGDQLSVIYTYIDWFCDAVSDAFYDQNAFMDVYRKVCTDSRKWYKV